MELKILKTYIKTHLKTGFIWSSKFPAAAPILFDKKFDNTFYLYINYWSLNNLTIKNRYPLPLIRELLDRLGWAIRFTQLDLISAYYQMRIKKGDKLKTDFQTRYGHWKYQVMPFGYFNTLASFQDYINKILAEKLDIFIIIYLNNIFIYTEDQGWGYIEAMRYMLDLLKKIGLFFNLKKCRFYKNKVRFLRYVVSNQGIRMEDEKIKVVKNWPKWKAVWNIQVFISFANFYWRFIRDFGRIATPLLLILKRTRTWDLAQRDNDNEVVGGGGDRNLSKSKKLKNAKSGI